MIRRRFHDEVAPLLTAIEEGGLISDPSQGDSPHGNIVEQ